jgi:hypothetical protein
MGQWVRNNLQTVVVAFVTAAVTAAAPAVASSLTNADTLNGRRGVACDVPVKDRHNVYVATCKDGAGAGHLPNNIIRKAQNADKLDGLDWRAIAGQNSAVSDNRPDVQLTFPYVDVLSLGHDHAIQVHAFTRIIAIASVHLYKETGSASLVQCRLMMAPLGGTSVQISRPVEAWGASGDAALGMPLVGAEIGAQDATYDIIVQCEDEGGQGDWYYDSGDLVAMAVR